MRAAYFGFAVGGVTLSLSSLIAAAAVFVVVVLATRLIQKWLSSRLLPQTRLDAGVSNSISTIFGYLGMVVAVLLGGAQIGLDAQKLALVAGGLSVGIGFGLQTIANNFISGLILLWERGIRVGDWVVVGDRPGLRAPDQRARHRDRDLRPGDADRAELEFRHRSGQELGSYRSGRPHHHRRQCRL